MKLLLLFLCLVDSLFSSEHPHSKRKKIKHEASSTTNQHLLDDNGYLCLNKHDYVNTHCIQDKIGQGSFANVYQTKTTSNRTVALKTTRVDQVFYDSAQKEIEILRHIQHHTRGKKTNSLFIKLLDYFAYHFIETHTHTPMVSLCLIFDYHPATLYQYNHHYARRPQWSRSKAVARQLFLAFEFLETLAIPIIHGDLKPENILVKNPEDPEHPEIKVIDFGSAFYLHEKMSPYIQSRWYRAPEVLAIILSQQEKTHFTPAIDSWSIACVLFETHTNTPLFVANSTEQLFLLTNAFCQNTLNKLINRLLKGKPNPEQRAKDPTLLSFINLLQHHFTQDPKYRIKAAEALKHPFLSLD